MNSHGHEVDLAPGCLFCNFHSTARSSLQTEQMPGWPELLLKFQANSYLFHFSSTRSHLTDNLGTREILITADIYGAPAMHTTLHTDQLRQSL